MKKGNVKDWKIEREYDNLEDAEIMQIIHANARKRKNVKYIKKEHKVLKIAVYVSEMIVLYGLGVLTGVLWMK